jgi:sialic acid synthase SpsE
MLYSTNSRFPTATTLKPTKDEVNDIVKIQPYKTNDLITNETLAYPFKQVENALKNLHITGDNQR